MKRRLGRWKECRRTSAGGQPRFQNASPSTLCPRGNREYSVFGSLFLHRPLSLSLRTDSSSSSSPSRRAIVCWLLIPPGASLVTHAPAAAPSPPCSADRGPESPWPVGRARARARELQRASFPSLLRPSAFGPPGCIGTPAAIAVGRHTGDARASLHRSIHSQAPSFPPLSPFSPLSLASCSLFAVSRGEIALAAATPGPLLFGPARTQRDAPCARAFDIEHPRPAPPCNACYCPSCCRYASHKEMRGRERASDTQRVRVTRGAARCELHVFRRPFRDPGSRQKSSPADTLRATDSNRPTCFTFTYRREEHPLWRSYYTMLPTSPRNNPRVKCHSPLLSSVWIPTMDLRDKGEFSIFWDF